MRIQNSGVIFSNLRIRGRGNPILRSLVISFRSVSSVSDSTWCDRLQGLLEAAPRFFHRCRGNNRASRCGRWFWSWRSLLWYRLIRVRFCAGGLDGSCEWAGSSSCGRIAGLISQSVHLCVSCRVNDPATRLSIDLEAMNNYIHNVSNSCQKESWPRKGPTPKNYQIRKGAIIYTITNSIFYIMYVTTYDSPRAN